jgi:hypothetical protein
MIRSTSTLAHTTKYSLMKNALKTEMTNSRTSVDPVWHATNNIGRGPPLEKPGPSAIRMRANPLRLNVRTNFAYP